MSDELFTIPPSQPTPLQSARRALAEAERELAEKRGDAETYDYTASERAVNRYSELVKAEELKELNNRAG
tara:strand:+ start:863 stop:1072 length:210 start_codon:yes stop_codon:yes gene_type:complete